LNLIPSITPWQKYGILQHGFIMLEAKYNRRQAELTRLREELRLQVEEHASRTNGLTERLESKEKELEDLHGELKGIVDATRAVKSIVDQVRPSHRLLSVGSQFD
jgi:predicted nuclease with TOPRIM domain